MPQYNIGTVTVTQGSNQVQGSTEVDWSFVVEGDLFTKTGTTLIYTIGACNPTTKVIALIENYVGASEAGMAYEISWEFSPQKNLPLPSPKDTNAVAIIRRALLAIDSFDTGYSYYAYASDDQGTGFTLTFNPALDYLAFLKSAVEIPTPQASDFVGLWRYVRGAQGIQGLQGQPGPAWDQWRGPWVTATGYIIKDAVSTGGSSYICRSSHTSGSISEPGSGTNWQSYWDVIAEKGTASAGDIAGAIHAAASKTTPNDADEFGGADSAASFGLKKYSWANIKAAIKTYNADGLTHLLHPTLDGNFRDLYRAGALPAWFNQQWGGAQWGSLPAGSFGSVATGNIEYNGTNLLGYNSALYLFSTKFKVSETASYDSVLVRLCKVGNPTGNLTARIYNDSAGAPNTAIGTASVISCKVITSKTDGEWYELSGFAASLIAGNQYHLALTLSTTADTVNFIRVCLADNSKYPGCGTFNSPNGGPWVVNNATSSFCFLIKNPTANSLIQSGGIFGNYKLCFNPGNPVNQSRSLAQPLSQFYDGKECSVIHRGTYAVSSNVWDFAYGLDHDRITVTVNASGYPVLSIYEADRTLAQVTGTGSVTTGNHDVAIRVRTVGDGADYAYLSVDGVSVGTPLTAQTFTMSKEMRELGTARIGDGFGIIPAWTQDMQMTSLPSAQGWTWGGGTEADMYSVSGGKLYQNANGFLSTTSAYYYKTVSLVNATGWAVEFSNRCVTSTNTLLQDTNCLRVQDGAKLVGVNICEYFLEIGVTGSSYDLIVQGDFKSKEHVFVLQGQGSDYYLFCDGKLIADGTGRMTSASAANQILFGDVSTAAGHNGDAIWSYVKYYTGGMILPIANNKDCSEFAHWSGDKSALFAPLWNAGSPVSVKQLCGVEKNYVGEGVVQKGVMRGVVTGATASTSGYSPAPDLSAYIIGSDMTHSHNMELKTSYATACNIGVQAFVDGEDNVAKNLRLSTSNVAASIITTEVNDLSSKVPLGLHKVETKGYQDYAATMTFSGNRRQLTVEAKS